MIAEGWKKFMQMKSNWIAILTSNKIDSKTKVLRDKDGCNNDKGFKPTREYSK